MSSKVGRRGSCFLIVILILVISTGVHAGFSFYFEKRYHVHLLNRMRTNVVNEPLIVHVRSGDNDFGEHAVWQNGDFQFSFKINFWESTLFYSEFKHGNKTKKFDIFVYGFTKSESEVCRQPRKTVYWKVKDDGFYRSCDDQNYEKLHDWANW